MAAGNYEMGVMTGESAVEYLTEKNGSPLRQGVCYHCVQPVYSP